MKSKRKTETWQNICRRAQKDRDDTLAMIQPPLTQLPDPLPDCVVNVPKTMLTEREVEITELKPEQLLRRLRREGTSDEVLTAEEVIRAFCRRASVAQGLVSLLLGKFDGNCRLLEC
jgi:amidase